MNRLSIRMIGWTGLLCLLVLSTAAQAVVISSQLGGTGFATNVYYGQGIATPSGGPWHDIRFSFDSQPDAGTTNYAEGDLFILSTEYLGTPAGLSAATTGFVGQSTGIAGGMWTFASSVTLLANTTYYFVMGDRSPEIATTIYGEFNNNAPGLSVSSGADVNYAGNNSDFDHILEGNVVPEPATLVMLGLGLALLGFNTRRKQ